MRTDYKEYFRSTSGGNFSFQHMTKSHNWKSNDIYNYNNNRQSVGMKRKLGPESSYMDPHVTKNQRIEIPNSEEPVVEKESVQIPVIAVKEESTDIKCEPASGKFFKARCSVLHLPDLRRLSL